MPSLYTEIEISAPRQAVWQALFYKENWKYWNTFLYDCDPTQSFEPGREVLLALRRVPGEETTEFQPVITLIQPEICLRWVSTIPGFQIEQVFQLLETSPGQTKYVHQENFSGVLTRVFFPFIRQDEQQGIRRMAWELKQCVETQSRPPIRLPKRRK
jgi:hypothetical protein